MRLFSRPSLAFALILPLLGAAMLLHIITGAKSIAIAEVARAIWAFDARNFDHQILWNMRLPRMLTAICVGAALSVSGALMQGVTRNPLADPGLLALMSGAAFGVVAGASFFGLTADVWLPILAALGALGAALLVGLIAVFAPAGHTPAVLLLAGAAVAVLLKAIVTGIHLLNEDSFASFRVWLSGAITSDAAAILPHTAPWLIGGLLFAIVSARQVTALSMGQEVAAGLGINAAAASLRLLICTVVLTAAAVSMVGPLGFVGLVAPHATRLLVGADYRFIIPGSALIGAVFLLLVDLIARILLAPAEIATGVVTSLLGAPLFILLVRRVL